MVIVIMVVTVVTMMAIITTTLVTTDTAYTLTVPPMLPSLDWRHWTFQLGRRHGLLMGLGIVIYDSVDITLDNGSVLPIL